MPVLTFTPDSGVGGNTVDFTITSSSEYLEHWADIRNGMNLVSTPLNEQSKAGIYLGPQADRYLSMERSFTSFDTSAIPSGSTINAALIRIKFDSKEDYYDQFNEAVFVMTRWFMSRGASDSSTSNWDDIDFADWWEAFNYDSISLVHLTDIFLQSNYYPYLLNGKFGMVFMSEHDRTDTPPRHVEYKDDEVYASFQSADSTVTPIPELIVDFTPPADVRITMII